MAYKTIKERIQLKNDTEANWNKARNFIPLRGEAIIYSADGTHPFSRLKIGDGTTPVIDLPFIDAFSVNGINVISKSADFWNNNRQYIPTAGQIVIYLNYKLINEGEENEIGVAGLKIGDGKTYVVDLPFLGDIDQSIYNHINDATIHVSEKDRAFWNNKLNCDDEIFEETLFLNRN